MALSYHDMQFRKRLDKALAATKLALDKGKCVRPEAAAHAYDDKFAVAESVTRMAYESALQFCELLGLDAEKARAINDAKGPGRVSLALEIESAALMVKTREKAIEGPSVTVERERESSGALWGSSKSKTSSTTKVTTKVTEYLWKRTWRCRLLANKGPNLVATVADWRLEALEATRASTARSCSARCACARRSYRNRCHVQPRRRSVADQHRDLRDRARRLLPHRGLGREAPEGDPS